MDWIFNSTVAVVFVSAWIFGSFFGRRGEKLRSLDRESSLEETVQKLESQLEPAERKAKEYFDKIEEVIAEREQWRQLYHHQAAGHDNAQARMMQQIDLCYQIYRRDTGKDFPRRDALIERVRADWGATHGPSARKNMGEENPHG